MFSNFLHPYQSHKFAWVVITIEYFLILYKKESDSLLRGTMHYVQFYKTIEVKLKRNLMREFGFPMNSQQNSTRKYLQVWRAGKKISIFFIDSMQKAKMRNGYFM